jgi:hypothetical protein
VRPSDGDAGGHAVQAWLAVRAWSPVRWLRCETGRLGHEEAIPARRTRTASCWGWCVGSPRSTSRRCNAVSPRTRVASWRDTMSRPVPPWRSEGKKRFDTRDPLFTSLQPSVEGRVAFFRCLPPADPNTPLPTGLNRPGAPLAADHFLIPRSRRADDPTTTWKRSSGPKPPKGSFLSVPMATMPLTERSSGSTTSPPVAITNRKKWTRAWR